MLALINPSFKPYLLSFHSMIMNHCKSNKKSSNLETKTGSLEELKSFNLIPNSSKSFFPMIPKPMLSFKLEQK